MGILSMGIARRPVTSLLRQVTAQLDILTYVFVGKLRHRLCSPEVPSDGDASLKIMRMVSTILKDEQMLQDEKFKGYVTSGHRYGALRTASGDAEKEMKLMITSFLQASSIP